MAAKSHAFLEFVRFKGVSQECMKGRGAVLHVKPDYRVPLYGTELPNSEEKSSEESTMYQLTINVTVDWRLPWFVLTV